MKYCPFCGYGVENVYTFCPKCGQSIPDAKPAAPQEKSFPVREPAAEIPVVQKTASRKEPARTVSRTAREIKTDVTDNNTKTVSDEYRPAWQNDPSDFLKEIDTYHPAWKNDAESFLQELNGSYGAGRDIRDSSYRENSFGTASKNAEVRSEKQNTPEKRTPNNKNITPEKKETAPEASGFKTAGYREPEQNYQEGYRTSNNRAPNYKSNEYNMPGYNSERSRASGYQAPQNSSQRYGSPERNAPINNVVYDARYIEQPVEKTVITEDNSGGFGWWILSFLLPLVGLVIYLNRKNTKPGRARSSAGGALTVLILLAIAAAAFLFGVMNGYISLV
ncbi:MAG: hypothetical protein Q4F31_06805 [Eubacteriales bacterium]|nr:hypothetical protein [Eubacteriales bacterium]